MKSNFFMLAYYLGSNGQPLYTPESVIDVCNRTGIKDVTIKVLDGTFLFNATGGNQKALKALIAALKAAGCRVGIWTYNYPDRPGPQGDAIEAARIELGADHLEIDIEGEWKQPGLGKEAEIMLGKLHKNKDIALCSYRYPALHKPLPFGSFLHHEAITFNAPQVYWVKSNDPVAQLHECINQYAVYTDKPLVPVGATFGEGGWEPSSQEIKDFILECRRLGMTYGLYSIDYIVRKNKVEWIEAIAEANGLDVSPPPVVDPADTTWTDFKFSQNMNVRKDPSASSGVIGHVKAGELVPAKTVLGTDAWIPCKGGWVCVKLGKTMFAKPVDR